MNNFVQLPLYTRAIVWFGIVMFCPLWTMAAPSITFNQNCLSAQQFIYELRLNEASSILEKEKNDNADNVASDYLMVVHSMLAYITNESDQAYLIKIIALQRIGSCPSQAGYRDFLLEEIYFYSSVVNGKRGNTLAAARDVRNCYKLGTNVIKAHPTFHAAKKTIGLLNSGFGSLPNNYQKLVQFFGYQSSMDQGLRYLTEFVNSENDRPEMMLMKKEAQFYIASIYLYLKNDKTLAWEMIDSLTADYQNNPLSGFARVNFADKCRRNDEIIQVISKTPRNQPYGDIPFLSFMMGKAKLNRLDKDADAYLLSYLDQYTGKNYIKSCYQKLSWHALIHGDKKEYSKYIKAITVNGNTALEEDEQALKYASSGLIPDTLLLKTRLLFDGGYYDKALQIIRPIKVKDFETVLYKTEYFYRKGRVYDALDKDKLAEAFYLEAMQKGEQLPEYYASYAALYLAEMKERNNLNEDARLYFKIAMSFEANKEYKKSIEHRAKNGLDRTE
jgi:hypothetical protein